MAKILYGICGIGSGHFYRQKPIIDWLLTQKHELVIFAYSDSLRLVNTYYADKVLNISEVYVPYYKGGKSGIDFEATVSVNKDMKLALNFEAFAACSRILGKPDLIISDYEPVSAQYGYSFDTKVISVDQQSKFFSSDIPEELNGFNYLDELMRLRMFFPKAKRIASSFFNVQSNSNVDVVGPIIRDEIKNLECSPDEDVYLVYISEQNSQFKQFENVIDVLSKVEKSFYVFGNYKDTSRHANVHFMPKDDMIYLDILSRTNGIICTAGHSLLSEAMYLNIPVLACPLTLYEQQLNAMVIEEHNLGLNTCVLSTSIVEKFINNIDFYKSNIKASDVLNRKDGLTEIKNIISRELVSCF